MLGFAMLYGGEDEAFTSFKAGRNFVNLIAQAAARQWSWWGRVIFSYPWRPPLLMSLVRPDPSSPLTEAPGTSDPRDEQERIISASTLPGENLICLLRRITLSS